MKALPSVGLAVASPVACAFVGCAPASSRSSSSRPGAAAEVVSPSVSDSPADAPLATLTEGSTPPAGGPCDGIEIPGDEGHVRSRHRLERRPGRVARPAPESEPLRTYRHLRLAGQVRTGEERGSPDSRRRAGLFTSRARPDERLLACHGPEAALLRVSGRATAPVPGSRSAATRRSRSSPGRSGASRGRAAPGRRVDWSVRPHPRPKGALV